MAALAILTARPLEALAPVEEHDSTDSVLEAPVAPPPLKGCLLYEKEVRKYDWDVATAMRIMMAESGCNPSVVNDNPLTGDYSVGLFQINLFGANAKYRPSEEWLKVPENNVAYAHTLYRSEGFNPWSTY